jgi:4-hydroxy-2-oxoheptanedioate aldolase
MISTAAEARSVVSFAKFPPVGVRGQGSPFACLEHGLATPSEYVAKANDNLITMIQIETVEGVKNIEEICQVEGVGEWSKLCKSGVELTVNPKTLSSSDQMILR